MACKLAIPTMSLGHCTAGHSLEAKLDAAKSYGYEGVEVCYEDLVAVAGQRQCDVEFEPLCQSDQMAAARKIRAMCQDKCIKIICLQPFMQYEGLLDRREHDSRFAELLTWIELARALGTDMIMMPASSLPENEVTADLDLIARDLQKAADAGRREEPHIRFAYENRCSATRIYRWEFSWDVVERVCRPNFGMCLDTFHLASLIFADPAASSGLIPGGDKAVEMSMQRLIKRLQSHRDKIFLVQMGDAKLPNEPIVPGSPEYNPKERPWTYWSQKYRLFYGETGRGAYMPIREIAEAIFNGIGYQGWVSLELFNSRMECAEVNVPMDLARRGAISWRKLADDMGWWPSVSQTQQL